MVFTFVQLLSDWENLGVFDYVLPFLLIFALVYGILTATRVLGSGEKGNKGVNVVVALAVALLSLRFDYVPVFFSEIFPRLGVGIAVFLVVVIFSALFVPTTWMKGWSGAMLGVGGIIAAFVVYQAFNRLGWSLDTFGWWEQYSSLIVLGLILVVLIIWVIMDKVEFKGDGKAEYKPIRGS